MNRDKLLTYCNDLLSITDYKDYAPNGLQVEGKPEIKKIVTGVTASQALIDLAIEKKADAILVHHGYFWKNEPLTITGIKQKRIKSLLANDINLIGYHLPLDRHAVYGNNAQLAKLWQIIDETQGDDLLRIGSLEQAMPIDQFVEMVSTTLGRPPLHLSAAKKQVQKIAWCSGGAQGYHQDAIELGADIFITGEVSEQNTHLAAENDVHFLAAGHHATERLGVKSLGQHLQEKFALDVEFIDINNPV